MINKLIILIGLFLMATNISHGQTTDSLRDTTIKNSIQEQGNTDSATVYVSFIVETSGKISNVKVDKIKCRKCKKEFKESLESEAIRVISSMPDLEPRKERVRFIQPIKFKLTDE